MKAPFEGGCQCGAVRYDIRGEPLTLYACHCTECQQQSASAFGMSLIVRAQDFAITQGRPSRWERPADSGNSMGCYFCAACGSRLYHQTVERDDIISVKAGSLDKKDWLQPVGHLWTRSAQPWVRFDEDSLVYATQPDDQEALRERWRQYRRGRGA